MGIACASCDALPVFNPRVCGKLRHARQDSGIRCGFSHGSLVDDDGFGDAVVHAAVVRRGEVLQKARAEFKGRGAVAEGTFDRLPQRDLLMGQRDDANPEEALAGRPSIGTPDDQAKVKHQPDHPGEVQSLLHVKFGLKVRGVVDVFLEVEALNQKILQAKIGGEISDQNKQSVDEIGTQALLERGEGCPGESISPRRVVGMEVRFAAVSGHADTLHGRDTGTTAIFA